MAPGSTGQIKATLHTDGRKGALKKTISVETADPNQPMIRLTLIATVDVELATEPMTVYFKDMQQGEQKNQKVSVKNTSSHPLRITAINTYDKLIKVDLVNRSSHMPVELQPNETLELLVNLHYQSKGSRLSKQVEINYSGGEAEATFLRVYATLKPEPKPPPQQTAPSESNAIPPSGRTIQNAPLQSPRESQTLQKGPESHEDTTAQPTLPQE